MNGTQFTPGPWSNDGSRSVRATIKGEEITIACARLYIRPIKPGVTGEDHATAVANARLIAAAPELLETLSVAINTVECASLGRDGKELPWYRMARAAISKALGGSPSAAEAEEVAS